MRADVACYNMLLGAYCRAGSLLEAEKLLETIFQRGLRPNGSSMNLLLSRSHGVSFEVKGREMLG